MQLKPLVCPFPSHSHLSFPLLPSGNHYPELERKWKLVTQSCPTLCDPMDIARLAPLSMQFSRQEYWSGLPFPSLGDLPDPGFEPRSPALKADSSWVTGEAHPEFGSSQVLCMCLHFYLIICADIKHVALFCMTSILNTWCHIRHVLLQLIFPTLQYIWDIYPRW